MWKRLTLLWSLLRGDARELIERAESTLATPSPGAMEAGFEHGKGYLI